MSPDGKNKKGNKQFHLTPLSMCVMFFIVVAKLLFFMMLNKSWDSVAFRDAAHVMITLLFVVAKILQGLCSILDQDIIKSWDNLYNATDSYTDGWFSSGKSSGDRVGNFLLILLALCM